jgi:tRNA pseudouridine38-40 synthase
VARYKLVIEYDGTDFVGWQRQENGPSVQGAIEDAVHAFSGERVGLFAAGRTDAGVHARGQVAHLDLRRPHPALTVRNAVNFHLRPAPVSILSAERVADDFHARFDATWRAYRYRVLNRPAPPALDRNQVWHVAQPLDVAAMNAGAAHLIGLHDFTTFRAAQCQARSPVKTLSVLKVVRDGDVIDVIAEARSFLHHQVRAMVGTLKAVGEGRWRPDDVRAALEARDRTRCGMTAPAAGLALMRVEYGEKPASGAGGAEADEDEE